MSDRINDELYNFIKSVGIEPLYFFTVLAILIFLAFWRNDLKNFSKLPKVVKYYIISYIIAISTGLIGCVLNFFGFFD